MSKNSLELILDYPRKRPMLPEHYQEIYEKEYLINRQGLSLMTKLSNIAESWMHYSVGSIKRDSILEIGAGCLNHPAYEQYKTYDIIEPFETFQKICKKSNTIRKIYTDISDINLENQYDKIFSIAVLEHLDHLPRVIARAGLLLKEDGIFQSAIPTEGGMLWHLSCYLTTGFGFWLRNKMSVSPIMRHEHINQSKEIIKIISYFFKDVHIKRFPLPLHHLSVYTYIEAQNPKIDLCKCYA